ncbi:PE-PGRS family protein [Streptomyces sp. XD-27]|uniref:PE-PGRS family protein n=1 Tax=Streptomyces sp. XD-27 TaxID=3062779 RepID=UPI0026F47D84|nr:PE-PGRS family protein [Streptomyces sp. XD-27]WKX68645.1 PE-PGRS family protein [Streptomyces sp. XD-27]
MTVGTDGLAELLRRAGLEAVPEQVIGNVVRPRAAWRPVAAFTAEPSVAVPTDRQDLVAEVNAQWHRLAVEYKIIGEDGVFLIDVGERAGWTPVRLTVGWDLATVLGDRPGQPEFVTLSADGDALLGVTCEEYEVWLIAVDRVKERQEAAAQAAARETPQAGAAVWASLCRGPAPTAKLRASWADGLALNTAAPDDVLHGLLGLSHHLLWRELPAEVVEAAVAHPDGNVRGQLAEVQPGLTPEHWTRLILDEPDPRRRWILTTLAADRRAELTESAYAHLAADPSARVRAEAARLPALPAPLPSALATDTDPAVRASACRDAWALLDRAAQQRLLADPDHAVRREALLAHHQDHPLPRPVYDAEDLGQRAVESCRLQRDLAEHLARHRDPAQRRRLAGNPHLAKDLVAALAQDPDASVRLTVSLRPELSEEQRAAISVDIDPDARCYPLDWVVALHDDPVAMRRLGASSHLLVRRSVARAKRLPADVVGRLARDEDRLVRLFLAESCDDAPPEMLLEVARWWTGSLTFPDRPRSHPDFPRQGLLRYADDPNPRMRRLALDDPRSTAELVERFSRDAAEEVRLQAATDPRLSPAAAIRLLDDTRESVRRAAAGHTRLPARVLVPLLRDPETAQTAARNPALPTDIMRQMINMIRA